MNQDLKKLSGPPPTKLRSSMDAAEYKHIVLGLILLKNICSSLASEYSSDAGAASR